MAAEKLASSATWKKPNNPKINPIINPEIISLCIIRHQSLRVISPTAIALITNVAACEPEFPPLEIIKGIKIDNTTALLISLSKYPITIAVNICAINKIVNQTARFFTISSRGIVG